MSGFSRPSQRDLLIAVFDGGSDDVLSLDLSFVNLKFHKVNSSAFVRFIDSFNHYFPISNESQIKRDFTSTYYYDLQNERPGGFHPNLYALAPIDFKKGTDKETLFQVEKTLKIMFPSDFQLSSMVFYDKTYDGKYMESYMNDWSFVSHWFLIENVNPLDELLLRINRRKTKQINSFIKIVFDFISKFKDFEIAIDSYIEAFDQRSAKMAYINYCIALESLVKSTEGEITYRICRTVAVINSDFKLDGETIFNNMKQFYALRSRIVHGDRPRQLSEYFYRLQALVSRTLLEIIALGFPDREALNKFVHENGYGDKKRIVKGYRKQSFNIAITNIIQEKVSKYKR